MQPLKRFILLSICVTSLCVSAETTKEINFENQREEAFTLESFLKKILYKTESVDSTCYRDQSSVENVCRMETHYKQECSTVPTHQECRNTYERECSYETTYENVCQSVPGQEICQMVTRYREECNGGGGGGRECRTIPGDIRCRVINGENRCEKIPPREECHERPGSPRTCHQVAYQERECRNGPSRTECHSEPNSHQVCRNIPRQSCEWIPAHNVCESRPYQENVCRNETVIHSIPYACKKDVLVPYEKIVKTHNANIQVNFEAPAFSPKMNFIFNLDENGKLNLDAKSISSPKHFALLRKNISNNDQGEVNNITATYDIHFLNIESELTASTNGITNPELQADSISFLVNGKFDQSKSLINLNISKKGKIKFNGSAKSQQFKANFDGQQTRVTINLKALGAPKLGGFFNKNHHVNISLVVDYSGMGEVIAPKETKFIIANSFDLKVN